MARQFRMTWNRKAARWFKKFNGKQFAVSCKELRTRYPELYRADSQEGSYQAANQWWAEKVVTLDRTAQEEKLLAHIDKELSAVQNDFIAPLRQFLDGWNPEKESTVETGGTLETVKAEFLAVKYAKIGNGLSAGRYDNINRALKHFVNFVGAETPIKTVNAYAMTTYGTQLDKSISDKAITPSYARSILETVKQFLFWCYESEKIEMLPRNLRSIKINVITKGVKCYTPDTVKLLLAGPMTERTRLFALLMLNCGFTQQDVSELRNDEIDWSIGVITRKRSKTMNCASVPVVSYPLWDTTLKLLVKHRSEGERCFVTAKGLPLVRSEYVASHLIKQDGIRKAWAEVKSAHKLPLKYFRKTSATLLASNGHFATVADLFLGHSARSVAERHYKKAPLELLGEGVKWLATQYGID